MTDLSMTIAPKSDQINADDLIAGPITITVTRVSADPSAPEQPVSINFEGDSGKPYKPCKSMRRVLVAVWGKDGAAYPGRSMTLYRDADVQFGGIKVGGIRISHMSDIAAPITMALTATRANRKPYTVKPLVMAAKVDPAPILANARTAAKGGTAGFTAWWNSDEGKQHRELVKPIMDEIKRIAAEADEAAASDPFGLPPADERPTLTPEQEAQILAQIERDRIAAQEAAQ
jgi:hypothetical protein